MKGNFHDQFLEGWVGAIPPGYSTTWQGHQARQPCQDETSLESKVTTGINRQFTKPVSNRKLSGKAKNPERVCGCHRLPPEMGKTQLKDEKSHIVLQKCKPASILIRFGTSRKSVLLMRQKMGGPKSAKPLKLIIYENGRETFRPFVGKHPTIANYRNCPAPSQCAHRH